MEYPKGWTPEQIAEFERITGQVKEVEGAKPTLAELGFETPAKIGVPFERAFFNPADLTQVPGIVGRLTDWTTASAWYPNRPLALGSSLVTCATLMGQRVESPTGSGLHLYVIGIARTSAGKQQPMRCAKTAIDTAGATTAILGEVKSSVAIVEKLKAQAVFCAFIDEYDKVLSRILKSNAGSFETDIINQLCQLWSYELEAYLTPAASKNPAQIIYAPRVSLFACTTPENFYKALASREITGGFINRHLNVRGEDDPTLQENRADLKVPDDLAACLRALRGKAGLDKILNKPMADIGNDSGYAEPPPKPVKPEIILGWGPGAKEIWTGLASTLRAERDELKQNIFARVAEMTVRLASIVAFGRGSLVVEVPDMEWARALAMRSAQDLHEGVLKHMEDPKTHNAMCEEILRMLRTSDERLPDGSRFLSLRDINRKCRKYKAKGGDVDAALKQLSQEERIGWDTRATAGRSSAICKLLEE